MELSNSERQTRNGIIRTLLTDLGNRSELEKRHAGRVAVYATATGNWLGLDADQLLCLRYAAELHDLGKLEFPSHLFEAGPKVASDESLISSHPQAALDRLAHFDWLHPSFPSILYHHERWEGSGYPRGLKAEDIPVGARIIAVAEAFDSMTMPSGWREPIAERLAIQELQDHAGSQFDPTVLAAFLKVQPIIQPVGL